MTVPFDEGRLLAAKPNRHVSVGKNQTGRASFSALMLALPPRRQLNTLPLFRLCSPAHRCKFRAPRLMQDSPACKHPGNLASGRRPLRTPDANVLRVRNALASMEQPHE